MPNWRQRLHYKWINRIDVDPTYINNEFTYDLEKAETFLNTDSSLTCVAGLSICQIRPVLPAWSVDWYYGFRMHGIQNDDRISEYFVLPMCGNCILIYLDHLSVYTHLLAKEWKCSYKNAILIRDKDYYKLDVNLSHVKHLGQKSLARHKAVFKRYTVGMPSDEKPHRVLVHANISEYKHTGLVELIFSDE
jgi:hypothetical protein